MNPFTTQLYSAGLDVFPNEPEIDQRLVEMNHITLLPHMGTEARGTQRKVSRSSPSAALLFTPC
jgi:lactate dehydrogenase-like 2-hydroxyacid dehydrogenase